MNLGLVFVLSLTIIGFVPAVFSAKEKKLFCYLASYSVYRQGSGSFTANKIDPNLCTHLIYAFVGIDEKTHKVKSIDPYNDFVKDGVGIGSLKKLSEIKKKNNAIKTLISIGGWGEGSVKFSTIAASAEKRRIFIDSIIDFLKDNNYDGVDINWLYPNNRGGTVEDKDNLVTLLKEIKEEFKKYGYILVAVASGNKHIYKSAYDVQGMSEQVDYLILITYDLHGFWDKKTGIFAPIASTDGLDVNSTIHYYIENMTPKNKIILGLATHGRTFIADGNFVGDNFFSVPANDSFQSTWTKEKGFIGYNELCMELKEKSTWTKRWDELSRTPFAVNEKKLVSYDDEESHKAKVALLNHLNLAGAAVWSLDTDDFNGLCNGSAYPLTRNIARLLKLNSENDEETMVNNLVSTWVANFEFK